ncbi:hypothetical protein POTOM_056715 [Populus tomentosa]|uniref:FBD domain-containing protein n=1 Tax=Populus tomentosa TaxID=118781 RepID=A0A8X8C111_POPTO|nr:hypothetical protein POTOM_056715 [Populus tomentosa]
MHVVFDFSSVPKLKRFVIGASERQLHYVFTRLSRHVPRMRSLTVICIPERITIFKDVAELNLLFNSNTEFDILKMIAILRASPSLQKLYLEVTDAWCNYPQKDPFFWFESSAEFTFRGSVQIRNLRTKRKKKRGGRRAYICEEAYRKLHEPDYPLNVSESLWDSTIKFKLFNVLGCALPFALLCLKLSVLACFLSPC